MVALGRICDAFFSLDFTLVDSISRRSMRYKTRDTFVVVIFGIPLALQDLIMPPRKAPRTRTTPATTTNTTSVTNAQLQAMIDQGVAAALATRDANRSTNGEDSHNSGTGVRRTERVARECTYQLDHFTKSFKSVKQI
ncbi:hypothetical protein Tco_0608231 [Tanacetum coccineum]